MPDFGILMIAPSEKRTAYISVFAIGSERKDFFVK